MCIPAIVTSTLSPAAVAAFKENPIDKLVEEQIAKLQNTQMFQTIANAWQGSGDDLDSILEAMGDNFKESFAKLLVLNPEDDGGDDETRKKKVFGMTDDEMNAMIQRWGEYQNAIMGVANAYDKLRMQQIEQARKEQLTRAESIRSERARQKEIDRINDEFDKKVKKQKEDMRDIKIAEAISNTALGITKAYSDPGGVAGWIMSGLIAVQGALQIATIKGQKYQYGGLVGGNRHSQGGTMIEAERGEFVVSRRGVDAVGLEALNRINDGAGGTGTTVVINNPILSKDIVEDELVPQIKEALRRGGEIGVG